MGPKMALEGNMDDTRVGKQENNEADPGILPIDQQVEVTISGQDVGQR